MMKVIYYLYFTRLSFLKANSFAKNSIFKPVVFFNDISEDVIFSLSWISMFVSTVIVFMVSSFQSAFIVSRSMALHKTNKPTGLEFTVSLLNQLAFFVLYIY